MNCCAQTPKISPSVPKPPATDHCVSLSTICKISLVVGVIILALSTLAIASQFQSPGGALNSTLQHFDRALTWIAQRTGSNGLTLGIFALCFGIGLTTAGSGGLLHLKVKDPTKEIQKEGSPSSTPPQEKEKEEAPSS